MNRRDYPVRVYRRGEQPPEPDPTATTVEERLAMMWPLALEAWAFKGEPVIEPRLPRHVVRVIRGGRCMPVREHPGLRLNIHMLPIKHRR
jgi:hypothetical protein